MGIYYALVLFIVMPSMAAPILLLWELTVLGSDHTRDPRVLIYLIPVALITAALIWGGWLVERIPGWKYNALIVEKNKKIELARAEAAAQRSTDSNQK